MSNLRTLCPVCDYPAPPGHSFCSASCVIKYRRYQDLIEATKEATKVSTAKQASE